MRWFCIETKQVAEEMRGRDRGGGAVAGTPRPDKARPPGSCPRMSSFYRRLARSPKTGLRGFDQLHFSISSSVQDHDFAFGVAEDENVAVAEVSLFDGLFERHGTHGYGLFGAD